MHLVYKAKKGDEVHRYVCVGDQVTLSSGEKARVEYFTKPHKPSSQGKVTVRFTDSDAEEDFSREYFVSVIGAEWINREDQI